jgi:hypothetical protein
MVYLPSPRTIKKINLELYYIIHYKSSKPLHTTHAKA